MRVIGLLMTFTGLVIMWYGFHMWRLQLKWEERLKAARAKGDQRVKPTCHHDEAVEVYSVVKELVAWWCAACETQLAAEWKPVRRTWEAAHGAVWLNAVESPRRLCDPPTTWSLHPLDDGHHVPLLPEPDPDDGPVVIVNPSAITWR